MTQGIVPYAASRAAIVSLTLLLWGCPSGTGEGLDSNGRPLSEGGGTPPPAPSASFESIQANIFTPQCTVCHAGAAAPVGLKLDAGNSYDMLVGVASQQVPALLRVAPGDPDNSYLIQKIEGTAAVGGQMPLGGPFLDTATVDLVRAWVLNGAPPPMAPPPDVPPTVLSTTPADGDTLTTVPMQVTVRLSRDLDASLVSDMTVVLSRAGDDEMFDTADDQIIVPSSVGLAAGEADTLVVDLDGVTLPDDEYRLRLVGSGATALADLNGLVLDGDADGNAGGDFTAVFTLATAAPPPQATWRSIQDEVFTPLCVVCHVDGGQAAFLPLDEANSYDALVGVPSIEVATLLRVEPLNADDSYLVQKLEGTAAVGAQMPLGGDPLPAATIAAVRDWIDAGAVRMPGDPVPDVVAPAVVAAAPLGTLSGTVTVTANASDASGIAGVDFLVDDQLLARDTVAPFEATLDTTTLSDGVHTLVAVAQDNAGNEGRSASVEITVDNAPPPDTEAPQVTLTDPGATVSATITLTATATDNVGVSLVRFFVDDQLIGVDMDAPYALDWDSTGVADGVRTLSAQAQDAAGNTAQSDAITVTVDNAPPPDTTAPSVTLTVPDSPVSGTVVLGVDATDDTGVVLVRVFVDDVLLGVDDAAPFQLDFDTTALADGTYTLRAEADDAAGNTGVSANVAVDVDNTGPGDVTAPVVSVTDPVDTLEGDVTINVTASDDVGVVSVSLLIDDTVFADDITAPYEFIVDTTTLTDGAHTLRATARDAAGNVGQSATITVQVDNADRIAPTLTLVPPAAPVSGTAQVQVMASDAVGVTEVSVLVDGSVIGSDTQAPYEFTWDTTLLTDGNHVIEARAQDAAGNVGAAVPVALAVANGGPQPTLPWIQTNVFDVGCAAGCHIQGGIADFLRLDPGNSFAELVNVPAEEGGSSLRVTPGDPDDSALVQRLEGTLTPAMPLGGGLLPAAQIDAVRAWITNGALETPTDQIAPAVALDAVSATVSGVVTLAAFAVDDTGVVDVRFLIDGVDIGGTNNVPYQFAWDTQGVADGTHTVRADALDAAGNTGASQTLTVTVDNAVSLTRLAKENN